MSVQKPDSLREAMMGAAVGLGAALAVGFGLSAFGKAPALSARLAAVERETAQAEALLKSSDRQPVAPPGALCRGSASAAAQTLRDAIAAQAAQAGVSLDALEVSPQEAGAGPVPLNIRLSLTGPYDSAVAVLAGLARQRPQVFADSLDLIPNVANVTLAFSGRVFCEG